MSRHAKKGSDLLNSLDFNYLNSCSKIEVVSHTPASTSLGKTLSERKANTDGDRWKKAF
jgi:hypothetical protein